MFNSVNYFGHHNFEFDLFILITISCSRLQLFSVTWIRQLISWFMILYYLRPWLILHLAGLVMLLCLCAFHFVHLSCCSSTTLVDIVYIHDVLIFIWLHLCTLCHLIVESLSIVVSLDSSEARVAHCCFESLPYLSIVPCIFIVPCCYLSCIIGVCSFPLTCVLPSLSTWTDSLWFHAL